MEFFVFWLKVGRLCAAGFQSFEKIIAKCGGGHFQSTTIPRMKQLMEEEEIVIIYGVKEKNGKTGSTIGHYFVGMKKEESCISLMDKRENMLFLPKQESMVTLFKEVILVWGQIIKLN